MKQVLFISYDFPPCTAPGAAVRTAKFAKYLPEFGWQATVLCRREPGVNTEQEPETVRRIRSLLSTDWSYQLNAWAWALTLRCGKVRQVRDPSFDLVVVSCPPFPPGLAALHLRGLLGVPLVVDFRDAWSLDPTLSGGAIKRWVKRLLQRYVYPNLERRLLHGADLLLANTESMQREYERLLGAIGTQMTLLPNGFDETDFVGPVELPLRERPQFLYCGRFSNVAGRTPDLILQGLRTLIDDGRRAELRIVGDTAKALRRRIAHYGLEEYVDLNPSVPHGQAVRELRHADVLVLYQEPSFTAITPVAGKTFEYVRSGRPILAILPPGDNHDIVRRYAPTSTLLTSRRPEDLAEAMRRLHDHWHAGRLRSSVTPDREFRQHFDRRELTRKLARLFNELVAGRDVDDTGASSH